MNQMTFRIQYGSDFHLENPFYNPASFRELLVPAAPYLVLAGDIGNPYDSKFQDFLAYVAAGWQHVFYVAGNHEYYTRQHKSTWPAEAGGEGTRTMCEVQDQLERCFAKYENLHFLHESSPSVYFSEENVAIIGLTLWSHVPDDLAAYVSERVNDYSFIAIKGGTGVRPLTPADTNCLHAAAIQRLTAELETWSRLGARVCIVSHHMPSPLLIRPEYAGLALNCCFASDQRALLRHPAVHCWIYGHTHDAATRVLDGVKTCVNAAGYRGERVYGFRTDAVVEIDTKPTTADGDCDDVDFC
jgi:predicted phosphodiesterase